LSQCNQGTQCRLLPGAAVHDHQGDLEFLMKKLGFHVSTFSHERWEANGDAHRLARSATSLAAELHVWFFDPPYDLWVFVNIINK
jgi:hypothetical protein